MKKRLKNLVNQAVAATFVKGKFSQAKFKSFVGNFKKLPTTDAIFALSIYKKGIERELLKTTLFVDSPIKLSNQDIAKLKNRFKITDLKLVIDKNLLGGLKMRLGDTVIDDSVSSKIEQLKGVIYG